MLRVPDLDNITYEQLLENAIHKIPQLTKEWTDFNVHDPGITTLEIYAWLVDMLNYYINASGDVHTYKYMKLLGITPQKRKAATAWISMDPSGTEADVTRIPKGFPVYAQNKCFVTVNESSISKNRFRGLYRQVGEQLTELTDFIGNGGRFAKVFAPECVCEEKVYLAFEKSLQESVELYIELREPANCRELAKDFALSVLKVEYFTGTQWENAQILSDETHGLLRSGVICLQLASAAVSCSAAGMEGSMLRLTLTDSHLEQAPEIGNVYLNPILAEQKENLMRSLVYTLKAGETELVWDEYIAENERIMLGFGKADSAYGTLLTEAEPEADIPGDYWIDRKQGRIIFEKPLDEKQDVWVEIFCTGDISDTQAELGITDGCADQEYEVFAQNLYEAELLIGKEENGNFVYQKWHWIEELEKASSRDRVFTWDEEKCVIRFGDGIHGMVPQEGQLIRLTALSVSDYEQGNVLAGEICEIADQRYAGISVCNMADAWGGRRTESLEEMQKRLEEQVLTQKRLISPNDYEEQVKKIPGLFVKAAKVIPAAEYCASHGLTCKPYEVWLVVCTNKQDRQSVLSKQYEEAILQWLEPWRMLGTKIRVAAPSYTGIQISGKIRIRTDKKQAYREIQELIREYVGQFEEECRFGAVISHSDLFMKLEALECVEMVEELHLSPGGRYAVRNDRGDILLAADCLPYVGEIIFELNGVQR